MVLCHLSLCEDKNLASNIVAKLILIPPNQRSQTLYERIIKRNSEREIVPRFVSGFMPSESL